MEERTANPRLHLRHRVALDQRSLEIGQRVFVSDLDDAEIVGDGSSPAGGAEHQWGMADGGESAVGQVGDRPGREQQERSAR